MTTTQTQGSVPWVFTCPADRKQECDPGGPARSRMTGTRRLGTPAPFLDASRKKDTSAAYNHGVKDLHSTRPVSGSWVRFVSRLLGLLCLTTLLAAAEAPDNPAASDRDAAGSTPARVPVPAYRAANKVAILTVSGPIDRVTLASLERRMDRAVRDGADAIVIELDTPGGEVGATQDICHLLKTDAPPNTVAWVHPQAYSAGSIIALACREIVMSPNAFMGDASPIIIDPFTGQLQPLPDAERAKIEQVILDEVKNSARRNYYDENLAQAFISVGIELWMLENVNTGERIFVDAQEYEVIFGDAPPQQFTPVSVNPGPVRPLYTRYTPADGSVPPQDLPDTGAFGTQYTQELPSRRQRLTEEDRDDWRLLRQVIARDQILNLDNYDAQIYGLSQATIANDAELAAFFGTDASNLTRYRGAWSEDLVRFLTSWWMRGLLMIIFLICLFIEMAAPGVGVFGTIALVALLILIGAPYLVGMAQWWDILLVVGGLILIGVEVFILPGLGVAGILGAACLLIGMLGTFMSGDITSITSAQGQRELVRGLLTTLTAVFAAGVGIWVLSKQFESIPLFRKITLQAELPSGEGQGGILQAMSQPQQVVQVGDLGVADTDLRPAGRALIDDRMVDVRSSGGYIDKGTPVRVTAVGRFAIEVEADNA
jgi:membrane-bound serine protease (ClpP class)